MSSGVHSRIVTILLLLSALALTTVSAQNNQLAPGLYATVNTIRNDTLSVRENPGISYSILERLPNGIRVRILDGPVNADGYTWWQLETPVGIIGWSVESADGIQTLIAEPPQVQSVPVSQITFDGQIAYLDTDGVIQYIQNGAVQPLPNSANGDCDLDALRFSPDGRFLSYLSGESGGAPLSLVIANTSLGTSQTVFAENSTGNSYLWSVDWLPNSEEIVYSAPDPMIPEGYFAIWKYDLETGTSKRLAFSEDWSPSLIKVSHDGQYIVFNELLREMAMGNAFILNIETGAIHENIGPTINYDWSPLTNSLVYTSGRDLRLVQIEDTSSAIYTSQEGYYPTQPKWSPDGQNIAVLETNLAMTNQGQHIAALKLINVSTAEASDMLLPFRVARVLAWSPTSQYLIVGDEQGSTWIVSVDAEQISELGESRCADWGNSYPVNAECNISSVSINDQNTNGVVSGNVRGTGCEVILEITNDRPYWVNLTVSAVGRNVSLTPDGDFSTSLTGYQILPPSGTIRYRASFNTPGQTVTAFVDVTPASGDGARDMNFIQALLDLVSLLGIVDSGLGVDFLIEYYPALRNSLSVSTHFQAAAVALSNGNFVTFVQEMNQARVEGELTVLANALSDIGLDVAFERLTDIVDDILGDQYVNSLRVIWDSYRRVFRLIFSEPAGFVIFTAESDS